MRNLPQYPRTSVLERVLVVFLSVLLIAWLLNGILG